MVVNNLFSYGNDGYRITIFTLNNLFCETIIVLLIILPENYNIIVLVYSAN